MNARRRLPRIPTFVKKATLSLMVVVLMLGFLEVGIRLATDFPPPLFHADAVLGTTFKPGFEGQVYVEESQQKIDLRFNQYGFRGQQWQREKPAQVKRVALIGDSMVASIGTAENDTMAAQLQQLLNESTSDTTWEVMNLGVSGSSTGQELVLYENLVRQFQPDMVVCCFCVWNDLADNDPRLTSSPNRIYFQLDANDQLQQIPRNTTRSGGSNFLNEYSRLYVWQKHATAKLASRAKSHQLPVGKNIFCRQPDASTAAAWHLTESLIERLAQSVHSDGIPFQLAILPSSDQIYDENWQELLDLAGPAAPHMQADNPEQRLTAFGDEHGFPVVTMLDEFRGHATNRSRSVETEWLHFNANGHFNPSGNRVAAEVLHQALSKPTTLANAADEQTFR